MQTVVSRAPLLCVYLFCGLFNNVKVAGGDARETTWVVFHRCHLRFGTARAAECKFFYDLMHIEFEFTYAIDHEGTSCSTEAEC